MLNKHMLNNNNDDNKTITIAKPTWHIGGSQKIADVVLATKGSWVVSFLSPPPFPNLRGNEEQNSLASMGWPGTEFPVMEGRVL